MIFNKKRMRRKYILCTMLIGFGVLFHAQQSNAVGMLFKRVVFENGNRAEVVTIMNRSQEVKTYRLGWRHFKMTESKSLVPVAAEELPAGVAPSKDFIRFSPRRFTLGPGDTQQVRMVLRTPAGLPQGEYRSHLSVTPEAQTNRRTAQPKSPNKRGVVMKMLTGMSVPVIVRHGSLDVNITVDALSAQSVGNDINVNFNLLRGGQRSVYGDVDFICNEGQGSEYLLKFISGYAIYSEVSQRRESHVVRKKLDAPACSTLTIRYTEMVGRGKEVGEVLAKTTVPVQ